MEFSHKPVMLNECIEGLDIKPNGVYVDGTLGGAGHSKNILSKLSSNGKLIGIDKDKEAIEHSKGVLAAISNNFVIVHDDFKNIPHILKDLKINCVDGILLDLGVSSYQLDNYSRGFSYIGDGALDMRMNKEQAFSAFDVVNGYTYEKLAQIIFEYGDERFSRKIARNIVDARLKKPIETTGELVKLIEQAYPSKIKNKGGAVSKKTFQAIRIEVNAELDKLKECVENLINCLKSKGRLCIITFHSLEDRIVKNVFKEMSTGCICPPHMPICTCNHKAQVKLINRKVIVPSDEELEQNKRSHSAKLRIIEKL